ncbi:helix-turn-helix transcriptional regulator [Streptomyces sp. ISL-10]|uniref:helix-turn-helix transcriptional regulator n=1 Tax=Streptomyces sp. ISL-10 TaxID=2819172 RepID=UPI0027E500B9|nr:helix-turn-helix transcriptional regulator [Streptomyces sp. ISL-10]
MGERIQRLRAERGLTQRRLAEPAYTAAYVSTLEAGRAHPSEAALRHLAERLGVTTDELLTGRPAHLSTAMRLQLTEAAHTLATRTAEEAACVFRDVLVEAERNDLVDERVSALLGLGQCALDTGALDEALAHYDAADALLLASGAPLPRRAPVVRGRAVAHLLSGEIRYACYLLESAIDELNAAGLHDPDALMLLYAAVTAPYLDMGAHSRAAHAAELALALAPQVQDAGLLARMHRSVARTLLSEGRIAEADSSLAKAAQLYQQLQTRTELAHCHWMRGYLHAQNGQLDAAERELRTARGILVQRRATLYTAQVEVELADVLHRIGKGDEAAALLLSLLDQLTPERGTVHSAAAHRLLGRIAEESARKAGTGSARDRQTATHEAAKAATGDGESTQARDTAAVARAESHYRTALSLLERSGAAGDLADVSRLLGDLLHRTGRTEEALAVYRTGLARRAAPGTTTLGPPPADLPFRRETDPAGQRP